MRCFLFALAFVLLISGQGGAASFENKRAGVMATVNGRPITLHQVESLYDVNEGAALLARNPSVEFLQEQYGASLATLIVNALILDELEKRGFPITDEEAREAEELVRADYHPGDFETMLQESYIELDAWRGLLRQRLALSRFQEKVLRPRFSISREEIEARYKADKDIYTQPEKVDIIWFQDLDKASLEARRSAFLAGNADQEDDGSTERESVRIGISRLPAQLRKEIASLKPGQASPIIQEGGLWQFAVLRARIPARTLSIVEAYPQLEASLIESKFEPVYDAWLAEALVRADIHIVAELKPKAADSPGGATNSTGKANRTDRIAVPDSTPDQPQNPEQEQGQGQD